MAMQSGWWSRRDRFVVVLTLVAGASLLGSASAWSQCGACAVGSPPVAAFLCPESGSVTTGTGCGGFPSCQTPQLSGPFLDVIPQGSGLFTVRLRVELVAPHNHEQGNSSFWPQAFWYTGSSAPAPGSGNACLLGQYDNASTYIERQNVTCAGGDFGTYSLRVNVCQDFLSCAPAATLTAMSFQVGAGSLPGCSPPPSICPEDQTSCSLCIGPQGASSPSGSGPGLSIAKSGPGARLRFASGGAGFPNTPGATAWAAALGRGWSHEHTERIVPAPDETHVWLITRWGTFREFSGLSGGLYTVVHPSDEHRKLNRTATGWDLHELDGTVHSFDASGLWTRSVDRDGNAITATYAGGQLTSVAFPDGRSEIYTYQPTGKLASITENGVGGGASRTWTYLWSGDHLTDIGRPDGTAYAIRYDDARFPDEPTRLDLVSTDFIHRVEAAWAYDSSGNVAQTWKGDPVVTGSNAVEVYAFSYTNPLLPTAAQVTDPLGQVSTYSIGRDTASRRPKLLQLTGDCPACGAGPNEVRSYGDAANPLLPTQITDGRGLLTQFAYNLNGRTTSKTEAAGTPLARTTLWQYGNPSFPAFPTRIDAPSTAGGSATRTTVFSYGATGDLQARTQQGAEAGSSFSYVTTTTFNPAGQPLTIDPPGNGTADVTSFTYDPTRGNLLPLTRTDPLVGTTASSYDAFNRRTSTTDPNGVQTVTAYDTLDRLTAVTQKGATPAEDLTTTYLYNTLGDLFQTILPRGNLIEYGYDAAGRLISIERRPNAATHGDRTFYTLDTFGHRTKEELQSWNGSAWVSASFTSYVYSSRCHLDKTVYPGGAVTEYAYDCDNNLQQLWDANHPRASNPLATQAYAYDALNRLTSLTQPWGGAGGGTAVTTYGYDVQDHLNRVTDAEGNVTSYSYGDRDLMTAQVSPASGAASYGYNEHGELTSQIDARNLTTNRTVDVLDRVTALTFPTPDLNVAYTYDDPAVPFSKGRLTRIARGTSTIPYQYDRFGRLLQDGELSYTFDANGNPATILYPGGVTAVMTYDFADRPSSLLARRSGKPDQPLVSSASYLPFGPLNTVTLGNGLTETHAFTQRYFPSSITLGSPSSLLSWTYATDNVGNISSIADALSAANNRTYGFQDHQYFLTRGDGPWGTRSWTYDRIGNRLTETHGGTTDTYTYQLVPPPGNGHSPLLSTVQLGAGGTRTYQYDPAGNLQQISQGSTSTSLTNDAANRLAAITTSPGAGVSLRYDGRDYLTLADTAALPFLDSFESGDLCGWSAALGVTALPSCAAKPAVHPVYSSEGILRALQRSTTPQESYVFHFAGRPVAQMDLTGTTEAWRFLTTDHLGTPTVETSTSGTVLWQGGFEPFGADWSGAGEAGVFLRLPGQWVDGAWGSAAPSLSYNVYRWYEPQASRFTSTDPIGLLGGANLYSYAWANPTVWTDTVGLSPRPLPPPRQRPRACTLEEMESCRLTCAQQGKTMESCRISQTWRVTRIKGDLIGWGWVDGPPSCSCNDPDEEPFLKRCVKRLEQNVTDILNWLADHPPHPPVLPGPLPIPLPVP